jgi:hypothetical protein
VEELVDALTSDAGQPCDLGRGEAGRSSSAGELWKLRRHALELGTTLRYILELLPYLRQIA